MGSRWQACSAFGRFPYWGAMTAVVILLSLIATLVPAMTAGAGPIGAILDARIGVHDGKTRFVIELDTDVPYRAFTLGGPDRVVVDLPELDWKGSEAAAVGGRGLVAGYRHGLFKPGVTRVVIDLIGPGRIDKMFELPASNGAPRRLVLDIAKAEAGSKSGAAVASDDWGAHADRVSQRVTSSAPTPPPSAPDKRIITIDPGHGGVDPGAIGRSGAHEKHLVLAMAKTVKRVLEASGRYRVVMTRDRDIFIPLRRRYEIAHEAGAELFVSLHADSHGKRSLRGASVYTLSDTASDKEAAALARKENKSDVIAGTDLDEYPPEVSSILIDLAQQSVNESSWHFAEMLAGRLQNKIKTLRNPHRFAGFAVLKSPNVPSVLVETGYLSNKHDEANLRTEKFRERFARALLHSIDKYFARLDKLSRS